MFLRIALFILLISVCAIRSAAQSWYSPVDLSFQPPVPESDTTLNLLDKNLSNHTVFFSGEQHTHSGTMEVKMRLMRHLYLKANVRVMVEELPYAACWLMNRYMETSNQRDFERVARNTSHTAKEFQSLMTLFHFNNTKEPGERIKLRGTDTEYAPYYTLKVLDTIVKQRVVPRELTELIERARENPNDRKNIYKETWHYWKKHPELETSLGNGYRTGLCLLRCYDCEACYASGEKTENLLVREQMMYENYVAIINEFPGKKYYSQYGDSHVCLQPDTTWYGDKHWTSIACRLDKNADSPVRGKVLSMSVLTYDFNIYNTFNTPTPRAIGIWNYAKYACQLLDLSDTACPFHAMYGLTDYTFILNYGHQAENEYNALTSRNDPYNITPGLTNQYNAIYLTGNYGNYTVVGGGIQVMFRELPRPLYKLQAGIGMEFNTQRKAHTYNIFATTNQLSHPFYVGTGFSVTTDYKQTGYFIRPEIGLQQRVLQIGYAYNFTLNQRTDGDFFNKINEHELIIRLNIPVWKAW